MTAERLTCGTVHLPGCHNPWHRRTWCICGDQTWPGQVGTWQPYLDDGEWGAYYLHAPRCVDRAVPCVPHCEMPSTLEQETNR